MMKLHPLAPIQRSAALISLLFAAGTLGYRWLGPSQTTWMDALYMTVITLTTVGFGEIVDVSANPYGRIFTIVLLILGVGTFVYFISNLTAFFVEGRLAEALWSRRMRRTIASLDRHTIVCGCGHTGEAVIAELIHTERPLVVIERDIDRLQALEQKLGVEFPQVIGDATDDDALRAAGVERASGLVAAISNDKDNLIVTVSARLLSSNLRIVARCVETKVVDKLRKAGADAVVSPNQIGGLRLISELVRPTAVSFLDIMLRDLDRRLRIEEVPVVPGSRLVDLELGTVRRRLPRDVLIVALRDGAAAWRYNPPDDVRLAVGDTVIFLGDPAGRGAFEALSMAG